MSKRGENIHKRKDGRWEGRYKTGVHENGSTKYASVYGKTYTEVKQKLIAAQAEGRETPRPAKDCSFSEVLELWLENTCLRQKGATAYKYRYMIDRHIAPELGALKLSQMTAPVVNTFLHRKLQSGRLDQTGGLAPSYVKTMTLLVQSALQFAIDEQLCPPLRSAIYKPAEEKKELPILSRADQRRLEAVLYAETDRTGLGVLLSLHAGLRIGEVCALSWEDVDLQNGILHVRHTISRVRNTDPDKSAETCLIVDTPKTKASVRDVPISSKLMPALALLYDEKAAGFVLSGTRSFLNPRTYEYRYHKLLRACGIERINYHALRHTFATRCIEAGVDAKSLCEMLGHANVGITLGTYVHSSMDMKRRQLEKLTTLSA